MPSRYWSRITATRGPRSPTYAGNNSLDVFDTATQQAVGTIQDAGLVYALPMNITSSRTTMKRSPLLYILFLYQPLSLVIGLLLSCYAFAHVPVGKGFGITSTLAGIKEETLSLIRGAGFSGEMDPPLRLAITVEELEEEGASRVVSQIRAGKPVRPGKIVLSKKYS